MLLVDFRELGLSGREKRMGIKINEHIVGVAWVCR
jgi:hypothetical protein